MKKLYYLASLGCLFAEFKRRFEAMGEEVSFQVKVLCTIDERRNLRGRQM